MSVAAFRVNETIFDGMFKINMQYFCGGHVILCVESLCVKSTESIECRFTRNARRQPNEKPPPPIKLREKWFVQLLKSNVLRSVSQTMDKKPTKCSKRWATTTATAARREIISNIYMFHSSSFPFANSLNQNRARFGLVFFRSHSCTRLYLFAIPVAASAVARSLFHCTASERDQQNTIQ